MNYQQLRDAAFRALDEAFDDDVWGEVEEAHGHALVLAVLALAEAVHDQPDHNPLRAVGEVNR